MNEAKELDRYREYRAGAGRCCWDAPLHAWFYRAKQDRTEELIAAIREIYWLIKSRMDEDALIICEDIVAGDIPPAEQEES